MILAIKNQNIKMSVLTRLFCIGIKFYQCIDQNQVGTWFLYDAANFYIVTLKS